MGEDRHYLEAELYQLVKEDSQIFDFLQNGSLDGIWYWDLDDPEHEWISPQFWRSFGYDPEDMPHLASSWQHIIFQDDLAVAIDNFEKHCADANHPYDQIVRYRHRDGSTVWVRCRGIAIRDADGTPKRMLGAHVDVTALKLAERRLDARNRELQHSNRDLSEFAYSASHDLRSPLNTLRGLITVLKEDHLQTLDEKGQQVVDMIETVSSRLHQLTESVLTLADVTGSEPEFSPLDADQLFDAVCEDLGGLISEHGAVVSRSTLGQLIGNEPLLRRLWQNLIENSVKFRREDVPPVINVSRISDAEHFVFSVQDNGIGILPGDESAIFELFQRSTNRQQQAGVGLGLNLCRKIVELHGGEIWVEPSLSQGTDIRFSLEPRLSRDSGQA